MDEPVGELEAVIEPEHDESPGNSGKAEYGAGVTPRNTVLDGAVARTVATSLAMLYEYSVVAEVRYN